MQMPMSSSHRQRRHFRCDFRRRRRRLSFADVPFFDRFLLTVFGLLAFTVLTDANSKGEYRGCFAEDENLRDISFKVNSAGASLSADRCVDACAREYYAVAGLQGGKWCYCGTTFGRYGPSNCTLKCDGNSSQFCGGTNANSVYGTGFMVPGPPENMSLADAKQHSLVVAWTAPKIQNGIITQYKVEAKLLKSSVDTALPPMRHPSWSFSNKTFEAELVGLLPGSQYNVSVLAFSTAGDGIPFYAIYSTDIGEPERPPMAEITSKEGQQMTIRLSEVQSTLGPISAYQVVVIHDESGNFPWDPNRLTDYKQAEENRLAFYVTAELSPQGAAAGTFVVGDGGEYGGYYNAPLDETKTYAVIVGAVSRLNGQTKAAYSPPAKFRAKFDFGGGGVGVSSEKTVQSSEVKDGAASLSKPHLPDDEHDLPDEEHTEILYVDDPMVTVLGVAIGIASALLVASIIVYFMLRRHYGRREQPDHQELTLQSPSPITSENGIVSSALVADEEPSDMDFLYDSIKDKFWQIPRTYLEVMEDVLGDGKFGSIHKGLASRRNQQTPVAVHIVHAHLSENERQRRSFLNDLNALVRLGTQTNVVSLIGGCEDNALYFVCSEWHTSTLKEFVLDSRTIDHYPVYAERQRRASTLKEVQMLELGLGVARGMAHLAQHKIVHQRLTARAVVVVDEVVAKVTDFGLLQMDSSPPYDITRWMSMENFKSHVFTTKSDVWAFGVVIWELVTLGGTPYASVKTKDLPGRILRGARLHQPKNVGDDLYQMMLQCWQVDLDERPTFVELASILGNMITDGSNIEQLHLDLHPGFQYEKFDKELEIQNP